MLTTYIHMVRFDMQITKKEVQKKRIQKKYRSKFLSEEKAQIYGDELEKIASNQDLTPNAVVEAAKDENSPLHECFDWNNKTAAENWRKQQARRLINMIEIEIINNNDIMYVPAFESVTIVNVDSNNKAYKPIAEIMSEEDYRNQLVQIAWREIKYWKDKYGYLNQLKPVVEAIKKLEDEFT